MDKFKPSAIAASCRVTLRSDSQILTAHAGQRGLDFFLEAGDQFAVGGDEGLLGFDFGEDVGRYHLCGEVQAG